MCRMCTYYDRINLKELPTSNPFNISDELESPIEPALPNNIIVESPESQRHIAWQNLRRFPSLHTGAAFGGDKQTDAAPTISVYGPRELLRPLARPILATRERKSPPPHIKAVIRSVPVATGHRKLQHQDRILSFSDAIVDELEHDPTSLPGTPKSQSSISDEDEFSYLASSTTTPTFSSPPKVKSSHDYFVQNTRSLELANSKLLASSQAPSASTAWMAQICSDW